MCHHSQVCLRDFIIHTQTYIIKCLSAYFHLVFLTAYHAENNHLWDNTYKYFGCTTGPTSTLSCSPRVPTCTNVANALHMHAWQTHLHSNKCTLQLAHPSPCVNASTGYWPLGYQKLHSCIHSEHNPESHITVVHRHPDPRHSQGHSWHV